MSKDFNPYGVRKIITPYEVSQQLDEKPTFTGTIVYSHTKEQYAALNHLTNSRMEMLLESLLGMKFLIIHSLLTSGLVNTTGYIVIEKKDLEKALIGYIDSGMLDQTIFRKKSDKITIRIDDRSFFEYVNGSLKTVTILKSSLRKFICSIADDGMSIDEIMIYDGPGARYPQIISYSNGVVYDKAVYTVYSYGFGTSYLKSDIIIGKSFGKTNIRDLRNGFEVVHKLDGDKPIADRPLVYNTWCDGVLLSQMSHVEYIEDLKRLLYVKFGSGTDDIIYGYMNDWK